MFKKYGYTVLLGGFFLFENSVVHTFFLKLMCYTGKFLYYKYAAGAFTPV